MLGRQLEQGRMPVGASAGRLALADEHSVVKRRTGSYGL